MLLKDKYKPKKLEDLYYFKCYSILESLKYKSHYAIILYGENSIGKTLILNVLKNTLDKQQQLSEIDNYSTTDRILIIDDLDLLSDKEQFKIKKYLEMGGSFISTTSNSHKIIKDVIIRCITVYLHINDDYYEKHLNNIIQQENIQLYNNTIEDILVQSNYNIASAINLLQKISIIKLDPDIKINNVMWDTYYNMCLSNDNKELQLLLNKIIDKEFSFLDIIHSFLNYIKFHKELPDDTKYKIIKLILHYIQIYYTLQNNTILLYIFTNRLINLLR